MMIGKVVRCSRVCSQLNVVTIAQNDQQSERMERGKSERRKNGARHG